MTLYRHRQRRKQPLGSKEVNDDPLFDLDRILGNSHRLLIESKVDQQLFRSTGHPTEIRVQADRPPVINLYLLRLGLPCSGRLRRGIGAHRRGIDGGGRQGRRSSWCRLLLPCFFLPLLSLSD